MVSATISRWGNSLGIRIPKAALEAAHLQEGDHVVFESRDGTLVLLKSNRQTLEELLARVTPENSHEDLIPTIVGTEVW